MLQVLHAAQFHTQNSHRNHGAAASFSCCVINSVHKESSAFSKKRIVAASTATFPGSSRRSSHASTAASPLYCL